MSLSKEKPIIINGAAGKIEAKINFPVDWPACGGCMLIAHPHPLQGGTFDNKVVHTLARAALSAGFAAVRFNFRGVGESDGSYDEGIGEVDDMISVAENVFSHYQFGHKIFAGFSFGGYVASRACSGLGIDRLVLVAPAVGRFEMGVVPKNTLVIHGKDDDVVRLSDVFSWAEACDLPVTVFPKVGHFFHGKLIPLQKLVERFCKGIE